MGKRTPRATGAPPGPPNSRSSPPVPTPVKSPSLSRIADSRYGLGAAAIVLMVLASYLPAIRGGFVWDDDVYLTANPLITAADGLFRIWFSLDSPSQYFPLVYSTFRLEHALWGMNPLGYHAVNVLLHALNALLVWGILRRLSVPGAWLAAGLFALHPVQVESVAWITELKNVLSVFFSLLAIRSWLAFLEPPGGRPWRHFGLALALFALALFSKTTACTLPAALLLIVWLKEGNLARRRLAAVAPFLILGLAMGLLAIWWERHHQGTVGREFAFPAAERLLIAGRALWFYLGKLAWPLDLSFSYPRWRVDPGNPLDWAWPVAALAAAFALWWQRERIGREAAAAALFFVATLAPLLGFIPLYTFRYTFVADHYQYLAAVGPLAVLAAAATRLCERRFPGKPAMALLSAPLLLLLGALTWRQAQAYENSLTLWTDTVAKSPDSWLAHNNRGKALGDRGRAAEAREEFQRSVALNPGNKDAHKNLALVFVSEGKLAEALASFREAVRIDPYYFDAYYGFGTTLGMKGMFAESVAYLNRAVTLNHGSAKAHNSLGVSLASSGRVAEAVGHFREALRFDPGNAQARANLEDALRGWN